MIIVVQNPVQDTAQQRPDSAPVASTMAPPPRMVPRDNSGYLRAVFAEAILLFGGYWLLLHRRSARLRERAKASRAGR